MSLNPAKSGQESDIEKSGATVTSGHASSGFAHDLFNRARQIIHPDGRRIHVASSPGDVEPLRRKISKVQPNEDEWDIVIHGSGEHVEALRDAQDHHSTLREGLKVKHGNDFDEFERIIKELDHLNAELHQISEHAVNLDANFDKYGYSAHLRTIPGSGENSSSASLLDGHSHGDHEHRDWDAEKERGTNMVFFRMPVMRQYFHKGLLWRASDSAEVSSYELFIDLLYVGILAITGETAAHHPDGKSLLAFAITFIMAWKIWSDVGMTIAWISADDMIRRFSILFILAALLGLTTNMVGIDDGTYQPLVGFYLAARWFNALYFVWMAYLIPMVRSSMLGNAFFGFVPGLFWIGSIYVEQYKRQALIWIAICMDVFGPIFIVIAGRGSDWIGGTLGAWAKRAFEFKPGPNIEHRIERTNAFIALVFGHSVLAILYQSTHAFGINAFYGKAVLALIQAFTFNWLYFEVDSFNMHVHAIRRHFVSAIAWAVFHLPFIMAYVLGGGALSVLVLAHDLHDSNVEDLREPYAGRSEDHLSIGLIWFYCAGFAIALACSGLIAMSHSTKTIPNAYLKKSYRLAYRFLISLVILLLPLAHHHLNSLRLVAISTGLIFSVLLVELAGASCSGGPFWGFSVKRPCRYEANCKVSRKELAEKARTGEKVDVEGLARKQKTRHNHEGIVV